MVEKLSPNRKSKRELRSTIRQKGFTLIELLVVITVIGLLAAIVLVGLDKARAKARNARRLAEISQINIAIESYFVEYGHYPDPTSNPSIPDTWMKLGRGNAIDVLLQNEGLMGKVPADPLDGSKHYYYYNNNHSR